MRVIKFRGLRTDGKGWVYGHYTQGTEKNHYITNSNGAVWEVFPESVGQFTGLTDKNRVEIYEGDKLKIYGYKKIWETKVRFESGGLCIDVEEKPYNVTLLGFLDEESIVEIIGNIHQNKYSL